MKLHYLGTAAAEGVPAVFCSCAFCDYARRTGGKEIRTRAGSIIDDKIKLDFGPDSYMQMLRDGLSYASVHSVIVTHTHEDHLAAHELSWRRPVYAYVPEGDRPMTVYGNEKLGDMISPFVSDRIAFRQLTAFLTADIEGYKVTPLEAVHCVSNGEGAAWPVKAHNGDTVLRAEEAFIYLIEHEGKRLLYAHDTSILTERNYAYLRGKRLDLVSLDCTNGRLDSNYLGHMGYKDNLTVRDTLKRIGAADDGTVFVANHFSHNGLVPYDELSALLPGFIISYDGLTLEV